MGPWQEPADLDLVQTGAWILPDERPLPAELKAFLDAGTPPVSVGFGSMRAPKDIARVAARLLLDAISRDTPPMPRQLESLRPTRWKTRLSWR